MVDNMEILTIVAVIGMYLVGFIQGRKSVKWQITEIKLKAK